jgi:hypothetical protein
MFGRDTVVVFSPQARDGTAVIDSAKLESPSNGPTCCKRPHRQPFQGAAEYLVGTGATGVLELMRIRSSGSAFDGIDGSCSELQTALAVLDFFVWDEGGGGGKTEDGKMAADHF